MKKNQLLSFGNDCIAPTEIFTLERAQAEKASHERSGQLGTKATA